VWEGGGIATDDCDSVSLSFGVQMGAGRKLLLIEAGKR